MRVRNDGMEEDDLGVAGEVCLLSLGDALLKSVDSLCRLTLVVVCF